MQFHPLIRDAKVPPPRSNCRLFSELIFTAIQKKTKYTNRLSSLGLTVKTPLIAGCHSLPAELLRNICVDLAAKKRVRL